MRPHPGLLIRMGAQTQLLFQLMAVDRVLRDQASLVRALHAQVLVVDQELAPLSEVVSLNRLSVLSVKHEAYLQPSGLLL
jgi:hypothetical protein